MNDPKIHTISFHNNCHITLHIFPNLWLIENVLGVIHKPGDQKFENFLPPSPFVVTFIYYLDKAYVTK